MIRQKEIIQFIKNENTNFYLDEQEKQHLLNEFSNNNDQELDISKKFLNYLSASKLENTLFQWCDE